MVCYWFTGLSGSGKTTLAKAFQTSWRKEGRQAILLDGDSLRQGLNKDLGFSREDRAENVRRIAEVAKVLTEAGIIVIVSAIAPYQADRDAARNLFNKRNFVEVYVNTSIETCITRDPKGLYKKAKEGLIQHMTGIDDPYEIPTNPELTISTNESIEQSLSQLWFHDS